MNKCCSSGHNQRWATATLKIASLPLSLFAENNSAQLLPLLNENSSELTLLLFSTVTFGALLKSVLFYGSRVYFK